MSGVVAWSDTDASGWIHFTAPQRWIENAEHALSRAIDPAVNVGSFPRRELHITFQRPLRAGDAFVVELSPARVGNTSISYEWRILKDGAVCIEGGHTVVHLGASGTPTLLPDRLRNGLAALV